MRPSSRCKAAASLAALVFPLLCRGAVFGQSSFTLGFAGLDRIVGTPGETKSLEYFSTMTHEGEGPGTGSWSTSLAADGMQITSITIGGTDAEWALHSGFWSTEVIEPKRPENAALGVTSGAVSAIVFFKKAIWLPLNATSDIARLEVSATIPAGGGKARLYYLDNLVGSGEPVPNYVSADGELVKPNFTERAIDLVESVPCGDDPINVGFSRAKVSSTTPWDGIAGIEGAGGELVKESLLGATGRLGVYANVISQLSTQGVQAWSICMGLTGEATLSSATTDGLCSEAARSGGFEVVEVIDPGKPENARLHLSGGAYSAVLKNLEKAVVLPPVGAESLLYLEVASRQGEEDRVATLQFIDNLVAAGGSVLNSFIVGEDIRSPCNNLSASVDLRFVKSAEILFLRGDANGDSRRDIADPIWTIRTLFYRGPPSVCEDAADANDDGSVDSSDVVYLIAYHFRGGSAPPPPLQCGADPTADSLDCKGPMDACP